MRRRHIDGLVGALRSCELSPARCARRLISPRPSFPAAAAPWTRARARWGADLGGHQGRRTRWLRRSMHAALFWPWERGLSAMMSRSPASVTEEPAGAQPPELRVGQGQVGQADAEAGTLWPALLTFWPPGRRWRRGKSMRPRGQSRWGQADARGGWKFVVTRGRRGRPYIQPMPDLPAITPAQRQEPPPLADGADADSTARAGAAGDRWIERWVRSRRGLTLTRDSAGTCS